MVASSLRGRMLLLVCLTVAAAAASALGTVWVTYSRDVSVAQASEAAQVLSMAAQLVKDRFDDHLDQRHEAVREQRLALEQVLSMFVSTMEEELSQSRRGSVSTPEAQRYALNLARRSSQRSGLNVFVLDSDFTGLTSQDQSLVGTSWREYRGAAGPGVLETAASVAWRDGSDTFLIWWPPTASGAGGKHLARLVPFAAWGWYVGVSAEYSRLEARAAQDANHMVQDVLASLAQVHLGQTGRLFVLDGKGQELLLPEGRAGEFARTMKKDAETARETDILWPKRFVWPDDQGGYAVSVVYLPEMDWNLGLMQRVSELESRSSLLARRLVSAMGLVFLAALLVAWWLTGRIARPILELTGSMEGFEPMRGADPDLLERLRGLSRGPHVEAGRLADVLAGILEALNEGMAGMRRASSLQAQASRDLAQSKQELERLNRELENRVAVRTAALEAANERLRGSEARYRNLFSHAPVPFLEMDLSSLAAFAASVSPETLSGLAQDPAKARELLEDCLRMAVVKDVNPAALEAFGVASREELIRNLSRIATFTGLPETFMAFEGFKTGDTVKVFESEFMTLSGERRICLASMRPLPGSLSSMESVLVSLQDVTWLKDSENRLKAAHAEASAASKAKSEFLANMSHEIRTPLSAILGLAELSQRQNEPEKTAAHLRMITDSARNLLEIVGDVLDLSRVEAGRMTLESRHFELAPTLDKALAPAREAALRKGLGFSLSLAPDLPHALTGDPARLGQVLANLAGNAVKFTPLGEVAVSVELSKAGDREPHEVPDQASRGPELLFTVRDTGIGIDPELSEAVFESFRQADSSYSKRFQGVGLGLAISRELVRMMGGSIWLSSQPGRGSVFRFTARFAASPSPTRMGQVSRQDLPTASRGKTVLVVEDNPFNRHVFTEFLDSLGYGTVQAQDGVQALDKLTGQDFDLVLMDVQMPRMDGLEAVRRIRSGECGLDRAEVPVLALTAYAMSGDRERCLEAGMDGYMAKPVTLEALEQAVTALVGKARTGGGEQGTGQKPGGFETVPRPAGSAQPGASPQTSGRLGAAVSAEGPQRGATARGDEAPYDDQTPLAAGTPGDAARSAFVDTPDGASAASALLRMAVSPSEEQAMQVWRGAVQATRAVSHAAENEGFEVFGGAGASSPAAVRQSRPDQGGGESPAPGSPGAVRQPFGEADPVRQQASPMLGKFAAYVRERAAQAASQVLGGDFEGAARAGHDIKGTSMVFGQGEVNALGATLEQAARQRDAGGVREAVQAIGAALKALDADAGHGDAILDATPDAIPDTASDAASETVLDAAPALGADASPDQTAGSQDRPASGPRERS